MKKINFLFLLPVLLSSCSKEATFIYEKYDYSYQNDSLLNNYEDDISYKKDPNSLDINGVTFNGLTSVNNMYDLSIANGSHRLPSLGEVNLLILPICFNDSNINSEERNHKLAVIENTFFGSQKDNNYYSVAEYYHRSSYAKLTLKGEVADWFNYDKLSDESLQKLKKDDNTLFDMINSAYNQFVLSKGEEYLKKFDTDSDGFLDGVYVVYDYPTNSGNASNSLWWAFTTYNSSASGNIDKPIICNYSWSGLEFIGEDALKDGICHANTFIHETGHLFGIKDYYNEKKDGYYQPTGYFDMMDYNIGDHSPFSKYSLSWTNPIQLKNEGEIKLRPFVSSGDFILLPLEDNYDESIFNHYLLIDYFSPEELNNPKYFSYYLYKDRFGSERVFSFPNASGVRVYEVDASLGYYERGSSEYHMSNKYTSEIRLNGQKLALFHNNSSKNIDDTVLVHLLESSGENSFYNAIGASNATLFRYQQVFGRDGIFEELGQKCGYSFKVERINTQEVTLSFKKV